MKLALFNTGEPVIGKQFGTAANGSVNITPVFSEITESFLPTPLNQAVTSKTVFTVDFFNPTVLPEIMVFAICNKSLFAFLAAESPSMNTPFGHPMNTELYAEQVVFLLNLNALLYLEFTTEVEVTFGPIEVMFEKIAFVFGVAPEPAASLSDSKLFESPA